MVFLNEEKWGAILTIFFLKKIMCRCFWGSICCLECWWLLIIVLLCQQTIPLARIVSTLTIPLLFPDLLSKLISYCFIKRTNDKGLCQESWETLSCFWECDINPNMKMITLQWRRKDQKLLDPVCSMDSESKKEDKGLCWQKIKLLWCSDFLWDLWSAV